MDQKTMQNVAAGTSTLKHMAFALIYADNLEQTVAFYKRYFSFIEDPKVKMGQGEIFGHMGSVGAWIGSGYKRPKATNQDATRVTVMLAVESAQMLFKSLKSDGVRIVQDQPIEMRKEEYWFQFEDPSGNLLDVLGGV